MPNMSYCRFENTFHDFEDCLTALKNGDASNPKLSQEEIYYRDALNKAVKDFVAEYEAQKENGDIA